MIAEGRSSPMDDDDDDDDTSIEEDIEEDSDYAEMEHEVYVEVRKSIHPDYSFESDVSDMSFNGEAVGRRTRTPPPTDDIEVEIDGAGTTSSGDGHQVEDHPNSHSPDDSDDSDDSEISDSDASDPPPPPPPPPPPANEDAKPDILEEEIVEIVEEYVVIEEPIETEIIEEYIIVEEGQPTNQAHKTENNEPPVKSQQANNNELPVENFEEFFKELPDDLEAAVTALIAVVYGNNNARKPHEYPVDVESMIRRTPLKDLYRHLKQEYWLMIHNENTHRNTAADSKGDKDHDDDNEQPEPGSKAKVASADDLVKEKMGNLIAGYQEQQPAEDEVRGQEADENKLELLIAKVQLHRHNVGHVDDTPEKATDADHAEDSEDPDEKGVNLYTFLKTKKKGHHVAKRYAGAVLESSQSSFQTSQSSVATSSRTPKKQEDLFAKKQSFLFSDSEESNSDDESQNLLEQTAPSPPAPPESNQEDLQTEQRKPESGGMTEPNKHDSASESTIDKPQNPQADNTPATTKTSTMDSDAANASKLEAEPVKEKKSVLDSDSDEESESEESQAEEAASKPPPPSPAATQPAQEDSAPAPLKEKKSVLDSDSDGKGVRESQAEEAAPNRLHLTSSNPAAQEDSAPAPVKEKKKSVLDRIRTRK
eukprot:Sro892_g216950.1 n/a (650) ;mRNA; r:18137-20086